MSITARKCSLDRRPPHQRAVSAMTRPLTRYLSRQAAHPHGLGGRLIGRLWVRETATVNDAAVELLAPAPGESILEIGFGPGRTVGLVADRSASVTGVDVSDEMLRLATRRNAKLIDAQRVALTVNDGTRLPVEDDSVDAVLSVHNLYFWPEPETTINEVARVLRPGGRVLLVFRGAEHPLPGRLDRSVYRAVTTQAAIGWLKSAGFRGTADQSPDGVPSEIAFVTGILPGRIGGATDGTVDHATASESRP